MLSSDQAAAVRQLADELRATVQALEAFQARLSAREHAFIVGVTANASAALDEGDLLRIERGLDDMSDAAAILSRAGDRQ